MEGCYMLNAWIIEKIREEEKKKEVDERPRIQCPVPEDYPRSTEEEKPIEKDRGVFIIKIGEDEE